MFNRMGIRTKLVLVFLLVSIFTKSCLVAATAITPPTSSFGETKPTTYFCTASARLEAVFRGHEANAES